MDTRAWYASIPHGTPGAADPAFAAWIDRWFGPWARLWFAPAIEGLEHLPSTGPYVIVANHSGGGALDVLCLILLWWRAFADTRPLAGFAHPLGFTLPIMKQFSRKLGIVPSTYTAARAALASGVPLVVFPGGDHEAFRPIWQARRVDFAGRKGFLRLAREHRVPIVPLAIQGTHVTVPIAWRSRLFPWLLVWPRLVGVKRLPVTVLGLITCVATFALGSHLGHPWLGALAAWLSWTALPAPFVPWIPSRVRLTLLPPIAPEALGDDLEAGYARVTRDLQRVLGPSDAKS